ncbi:DNA mismatch repair protein MutS2 [Ruminococcaceae bacterium YRB3002]|nr:DNA mismatch repair protein MutS2 [Ruminococcaceae bacterium YRB3002]
MYKRTTFEEASAAKKIKGRVLTTLDFDKIVAMLEDKAATVYGREICSALCPTTDPEEIRISLNETYEVFCYINRHGFLPLGGFCDLRPSLRYAHAGGTMNMRQLLDVASFLRSVQHLKNVLPDGVSDMDDYVLFDRIRSLITNDTLADNISSSINSEDEMNDRASSTLYDIRRRKRELAGSVRSVLDRVMSANEDILQEKVITIRNDRYCLPVIADFKGRINGIVHDTSSTGQTVFIEPMAVVEINNKLRELAVAEQAEIDRILGELTGSVIGSSSSIEADMSIVALIDFCSSKAMIAIDMDAARPDINTSGMIEFIKARHPLIPKDTVVPVDIRIGDRYQTLVITGPNTGGKTVSLKTCGLLTLMVMAGLMIPVATGSSAAVFDRVLADIGDEQSIEQSLSTFSAHMSNIVFIEKNVKGRSLVILDELGSGTDPDEGAALAIAILEDLRKKGAVTLATTHYKELKAYAVSNEGVVNGAFEFDNETLMPTYKLVIGRPGSSNAFVISKKLGLPDAIISDAKGRMSEDEVKLGRLIEQSERDARMAQSMRDSNNAMKVRLEELTAQLEEERKALKASKTKILNDARQEQKEFLEDKIKEIEGMIRKLRKDSARMSVEEQLAEMEKVRRRLRAGLEDLNDDSQDDELEGILPGEVPDKVVAGGKYYITTLGVTGVAQSEPARNGNVRMRAGTITTVVKIDQLRIPTEDTPEPKPSKKTPRVVSDGKKVRELKFNMASKTSSELMLIGLRGDEALSRLERYIEECSLGGIHDIRIVHGKGTGVLRSIVTDCLSRDPRVESFRPGMPGEGDDGVTIARLV